MREPGERIRALAPAGLPTGQFIEGTICDAGGHPVAARVAARSVTTGLVHEARADDSGGFVLVVGPGEHEVAATAARHGDAFRRNVFPGTRVDLVLTPPVFLTGRAVAGGGPGVAGVRLRLRKGDGSTDRGAWVLADFAPREATTAKDGAFEILRATSLDGVLALEIAGGPVRVGGRVPVPSSSRSADLVVPVEPAEPIAVRGTACDLATGAPLAAVEVRRDVHVGRTGEEGAFRLEGVSPGTGLVEVLAPGRPAYDETVSVERGTKLLLRVPAPLDLDGVVTDEAGAPVADAVVCWTGSALRPAARTDERGRFRIGGIAPERGGVVQAWAAGFAPVEAWPVPGEPRITLRLPRGGRLSGRVSGPEGTPAAGVGVRIAAAGGTRGRKVLRDLRSARCDDDGRYLFQDLPEQDVWIFVVPRDPHLAPARGRASVPPGALGQAADIRLRRADMLESVVTDPDGSPVSGAIVRLVSPLRSAMAVADDRGRFALPPAAPWKEVLSAVAPTFAPTSVVVQDGVPLPPVVLLPLADPTSLTV